MVTYYRIVTYWEIFMIRDNLPRRKNAAYSSFKSENKDVPFPENFESVLDPFIHFVLFSRMAELCSKCTFVHAYYS